MPKTDPRIDDYIAKAQPFAQPILIRFREIVCATVPQAEESLKWGMPHFTYAGKILAGMAAFKAHASLIVDGVGERRGMEGGGMGNFGKIGSIAEMPSAAMIEAGLKARVEAIRAGAKRPTAVKPAKPDIPMPGDLAAALSPAARATFDGFAPSHRRDYLEWIVEAKRPETRAKRVAQAAEWLAEGKKRNWKYENC